MGSKTPGVCALKYPGVFGILVTPTGAVVCWPSPYPGVGTENAGVGAASYGVGASLGVGAP